MIYGWARRTGLELELPVHRCIKAGLTMHVADNENSELQQFTDARRVMERELAGWLAAGSPYGRALAGLLTSSEISRAADAWKGALVGREVAWTSTVAFLVARR